MSNYDLGIETTNHKKRLLVSALEQGPTPRPRSHLAMFRAVMSSPMEHLTEDLCEAMYEKVLAGNYPETAALSLGIPKAVWDKWWETGQKLIMAINDDPSLMNSMSRDEEMLLTLAQSTVAALIEGEQRAVTKIMAAGEFDWAAVVWWMSKMYPEKWGKARDSVKAEGTPLALTDTSGVLAVATPLPTTDWLIQYQEQDLPSLKEG